VIPLRMAKLTAVPDDTGFDHPERLAGAVDERAARISRIEGGIDLDSLDIAVLFAEGGDPACADRDVGILALAEGQIAAERVAKGDDGQSLRERGGFAQLQRRRKFLCIHSQESQIELLVRSEQGSP